MNISEIMQTRRWKDIMGYVYGWGAAVVMVGALFKLQHWPYAGLFLTAGLCAEAFIFFLSAFEPSVIPPDWAKVYPQLKEDYISLEEEVVTPVAPRIATPKMSSNQFNELLENADISPELLEKLRKSLTDLTNTASGLSDMTSASEATNSYVKNVKAASESLSSFAVVNNKAGNSVSTSVDKLVDSYENTTDVLVNTGVKIGESYKQLSDKLEENMHKVNHNSENYGGHLDKLNKNLAALNAVYELQLTNSQGQSDISGRYVKDLNELNKAINVTIDQIHQSQEHSRKMNENLEALNSVYGNMLGALNHKSKK